jgi:hypothetical protein
MSRSYCGACDKDDDRCECVTVTLVRWEAAKEAWRNLRCTNACDAAALDAMFFDGEEVPARCPRLITGATSE